MRQIVIAFLVLTAAGAAYAQVLEVGVSGGQNLLSNRTLVADSTNGAELKNGFRLAFRMTLNTYTHFGHEIGYAYNRTNLVYAGTEYGMATHQGFYDFLAYATREGSRVRPFIAGGGQFSNFIPPGASMTSGGGELKFGVNYGFGVKVKTSERLLIRLDFRQYASPKPDFGFAAAPQGWLRMNEISAGLAFTL